MLASQSMIGMPPSSPAAGDNPYPYDSEWILVLKNQDKAGVSNLVEAGKHPSHKVLSNHLIATDPMLSFNDIVHDLIKYLSYKKKGWEAYGQGVQDAVCNAHPNQTLCFNLLKFRTNQMIGLDKPGKTNHKFAFLQKSLTNHSLKNLKIQEEAKHLGKSEANGDC
jgi:hypothetical protein